MKILTTLDAVNLSLPAETEEKPGGRCMEAGRECARWAVVLACLGLLACCAALPTRLAWNAVAGLFHADIISFRHAWMMGWLVLALIVLACEAALRVFEWAIVWLERAFGEDEAPQLD